jgi:predicted dehydrogenase
VGHNNAFDTAFLRLRQAFEGGSLGRVVHVETSMGYNLAGPFGAVIMREPDRWIHRLPGGLPQNNISHPLSLVLPFLRDEDVQVRALGFRRRPQRFNDARDGFFDELRVHLWGRTATASLTFSCHARPAQLYVSVFGTSAQAIASIDGRSLRIVKGSSLPGPFARLHWLRQEQRQAGRQLWGHVRALATARLHYFESLHELIQRFYRAIEGRAEVPVPMREAVRATRIIDEIFFRIEDGDCER